MIDFLYGIVVCSCWGVTIFFLKYWRDTRDRFFLFFALAFAALSLNWLLLVVHHPPVESRHLFYVWRMIGFAFILAAIWEKNRADAD